ncbi:unnamed protein product, partial [Adineta ricciae]
TKRERRSSNNKNHNNNNIAKQPPPTESNSTISALVTGLTSTLANMTNDKCPSESASIKPTSIEINNHTNGVIHENGKKSPSKSLKLKIGNEHEQESISTKTTTTTNGHHHPHPPASNDHIYETSVNTDIHPVPTFEISSDDQGSKLDENSQLSYSPPPDEHHLNNGIDSGISSEITSVTNNGIELDKTNVDDDLSSASGIASSSIISAARQLETNIHETNSHQRESSPTSGVVIPEEKRVTDRVKVFEAAANNNDHANMKKHNGKNGHQKKPAPINNSSHDHKQPAKRESQVSPSLSVSTTESIDTQSSNDSKVTSTANTSKNKSKRPSLKKQIQNLLKIDKPVSQEESAIIEEQPAITNGKKPNTTNPTRTKRDNDSTTTVVKRSSPSPKSQNSPTNGHDTLKKRASPPSITPKRTSPRESPSKSQHHSPPIPANVTEFNMKPIAEPLEIRVEPNVLKKKSPSPPSTKTSNNGLLTSDTERRRSSTGVSKLIHTFQGNPSHELEQTVLVPRLRSPAHSINH